MFQCVMSHCGSTGGIFVSVCNVPLWFNRRGFCFTECTVPLWFNEQEGPITSQSAVQFLCSAPLPHPPNGLQTAHLPTTGGDLLFTTDRGHSCLTLPHYRQRTQLSDIATLQTVDTQMSDIATLQTVDTQLSDIATLQWTHSCLTLPHYRQWTQLSDIATLQTVDTQLSDIATLQTVDIQLSDIATLQTVDTVV